MERPNQNPTQTYNFPRHLTAFVGRNQEINEIKGLLADPACRLLTLVGVGGTGKTRLAIEAATPTVNHFSHGVYFVPLQAVQSPEYLIPALADALDLTLSSHDDPQSQLLKFLRNKELLLVLDNFEQVLAGIGLLTDILQAASAVKLLVTSREVLKLQEEWLYPMAGLATPPGTDIEDWADYDAVKLLVERVQRVRRDFSLAMEAEGIVRLCRLVEGMPLALELAATWTKTLACAEVADEIQRCLDFLSTTLRDIPERHRSMQAVFDQAWQRLTPEEQEVFMRLSVFQGGFRRAAAKVVAGATLPALTTLVDKSLLRWEPDGQRYQVHELLRQYAEERLALSPESLAHTRDMHAKYYTSFLGDRFYDLSGKQQRQVLAEIETELEDIRVAWDWTVRQNNVANLEYASYSLVVFFNTRSRIVEGVDTFSAALKSLQGRPPSPELERMRAALLTCRGWLYLYLGQVEIARQGLETAYALYQDLNLKPVPGPGTDPLIGLSLAAMLRGDYEQAVTLGQQVWKRAEAQDDKLSLTLAAFSLTSVAINQGEYDQALHYAKDALRFAKAANHHLLLSYIYDHLGRIMQVSDDLPSAKQYYQASYAIREEFDYPRGMAISLQLMAEISALEQDYGQAQKLYRQSLTTYQKISDRVGVTQTLHGLGLAAHKLRDDLAAKQYFQQALETATEVQLLPLTLFVLAGIGTFLVESGPPEQGLAALMFVEQHPASNQIIKKRARQFLDSHKVEYPPDTLAALQSNGEAPELDGLINTLLAELSVPLAPTDGSFASVGATVHPLTQPLMEPLSERELEVLQLLSEGLTNQQIAKKLFIVTGTVKKHTSTIYGKLGVSNRTQAVARARELNLLD